MEICRESVNRDLFGVVYILNQSTGSSKRVNIVIMQRYPIIKTLPQPSWVKFGKSKKKLGDVSKLINCLLTVKHAAGTYGPDTSGIGLSTYIHSCRSTPRRTELLQVAINQNLTTDIGILGG